MKKLRVAFIGLAHVHVNNLSHDFSKLSDCIELVGAADVSYYSEEERMMHIKLNCPTDVELPIWDDYRELLNQDIDIAMVCTDIKGHTEIVEEILGMGIHTIIEKPMALEMEDAKRMYRAYEKSEAELIINWPVAWFPTYNKAKELADSKAVGDVLRIHYRSPSTRGPYKLGEYTPEELSKLWWYKSNRGGGSISDYAGYGCLLTTWIANRIAKRVSGFKQNFMLPFSDVEDYSTFTIDFGDSIGIIEGSWSTMSNGQIPTGPIVYGTKGVIVADRFDPCVKVYKELKPYQTSPEPDEVYEVGGPKVDGLAQNIIEHFTNGQPLHELLTPEFNMRMMAAFDAGRRSCESGQIEKAIDPFQL